MHLFYQQLLREQQTLSKTIEGLQATVQELPKGSLHTSGRKKKCQYYWSKSGRDREPKGGIFLKKSELPIAQALAKKEYLAALLSQLTDRQKWLSSFIIHYHPNAEINSYSDMIEAKKALVEPLDISDEEYARRWQAVEYEPNPAKFNDNEEIYTNRGERVRSRIEKIIADELYRRGIPYRYECPYVFQEGTPNGTVYPDFTILNVRTRKVIIWEHFGLMSNPEYVNDCMRKISNYHRCGELLGVSFIATFESSIYSFNTNVILRYIEEMLI